MERTPLLGFNLCPIGKGCSIARILIMEHHSSVETESQGINNSYSGYNLKDAFNNGLVEFTSFIEGLPDSQRKKLLWLLLQQSAEVTTKR